MALVAAATGATRATIYSWFYGNPVSNAYRHNVTRLITILNDAPTAAVAWSRACKAFPIQTPSLTVNSSASPMPTS